MSDQGFDFRPQPPRREARPFEPPPWEQDQFDELAAKRAREDEARRQADEEAARVASASEASGARAPEASEPAPIVAPSLPASEMVAAGEAPATTEAERPGDGKPSLDDQAVARMLIGLRAEEPEALQGAWAVSLGAGIMVGVIGVIVAIWGMAAMGRSGGMGAVGTMAATILLLFGLGFLGIGGWLIFRALRQRGVL